ncbi:UNVERIFIED_CONTAM: hypothetical protein HDU68_002716 [Siphonaria sp. JEL0065]|nr:hypothetical protein HDU68_002716 [Siphonaria sp. JEL0065]
MTSYIVVGCTTPDHHGWIGSVTCSTALCDQDWTGYGCGNEEEYCDYLYLDGSLQCSASSVFMRSGGNQILRPVNPSPTVNSLPVNRPVITSSTQAQPLQPLPPAKEIEQGSFNAIENSNNGGGGGGGINANHEADPISHPINTPTTLPFAGNAPGLGMYNGSTNSNSSYGTSNAGGGMSPTMWVLALGAGVGIVAAVFAIGLFAAFKRPVRDEDAASSAVEEGAVGQLGKVVPTGMAWIQRVSSVSAFWNRDDFFDDDSLAGTSGNGTLTSSYISANTVRQVEIPKGDSGDVGSDEIILDHVSTDEMKAQEMLRLEMIVKQQQARAEYDRILQEMKKMDGGESL